MTGKREAAAAGTAHGSEGIEAGTAYCPTETRATQRQILLDHLRRHGSISTIEARLQHHIMSPASRVKELRDRGEHILTRRDRRQRCARYHLMVDQAEG
ncbi:helix-turn-helix domain-containing protein [uncultured Thiohalocapsa sp.]|uniref:helix-turn-helix domain-containing protein n=1 Tax=uncultured Thiohalocapsa sp. TaxID=768990 RepID=UPI0025E2224F|nr:helix-turn-helix domain-containing protein [uncultured Thiohalocapsa sp.]